MVDRRRFLGLVTDRFELNKHDVLYHILCCVLGRTFGARGKLEKGIGI